MEYNPFWIVGALLGALIIWVSQASNRRQQRNLEWIKAISDHNWKLLQHQIDPQSKASMAGEDEFKIRVICYQHLNLFFMAWLNRGLCERNKFSLGLRNWAIEIKRWANKNKIYAKTYADIFVSEDLYSKDFINWLENKMGLSAKAFKDIFEAT